MGAQLENGDLFSQYGAIGESLRKHVIYFDSDFKAFFLKTN